MRGKATLLLIALTTLGAHAAHAGIDKAGTTAANFLTIGAGADVLSMGGATLGFGSSLNAASWNAAALGGLRSTEYVFSHASLAGESPQEWIAAGGRLGAMRTRWGLTGLYQGDGTFEGRDALNNPTGDFNASSMALGLQFAQPISPFASVGLGAKYVSERLGDVTGGGMTFDFGMRMQAGPLGFGAAAQNAFGKMSYSGALYDFPTNYGAGIAYTMPLTGLTFALDANFPTSYYSDVRGGVEWRWHDRLALRTGYRKEMGSADGEPLGGPTFGMGAGANGFWFDYGYLTGGDGGGGQHRMALTYHPGFMNGDMAESETHAEPKESTPKAPKTTTPKTSTTKLSSSSISTPKAPKNAAPKTESAAAAAAVAAPVAAVAPEAKPDKKAPKPGSYAAAVRAAELEAAAKTAAPATPASPTPAPSAPASPTSAPAVAAPAAVATGAALSSATTGAKTPPSTPATTSVAPERTAPMAKVSPSASAGPATQAPAPTNSTASSAKTAVATPAPSAPTSASISAPAGAATTSAAKASVPAAKATPPAAKTPAAPAAKTPAAPAAKTPAGFTDAQTMGDVPVAATPTTAKPSAPEAAKVEPAKTAAPVATKTEEAPAPKSEQIAAVVPTTAPATPAPAAPAPATPAPAVEKPAAAPAAPAMAARPSAAPTASKKDKDEEESAPAGKRPEKVKLKSGETLADLAKRWNTTAAAIMMANNLVSEKVKPGTSLKLPPAGR